MTFAEAAEYVLSQAGEPLHFREITEQAIKLQLIEVDGQTPWNSMNGTLRRLIRNQGDQAPFVSLGNGMFGLRAWGLSGEPLSDTAPHSSITSRQNLESRKLSPTDYKWRTIGDALRERLSQRPSLPLYAQVQQGLSALLTWGLGGLVSGLALLLGSRAPLVEGLASQLLVWGAAHSALALHAMGGIAKQEQANPMTVAHRPCLETQKMWYRQVLFAGTALGLFAMLCGWKIHNRLEEEPRQRGAGLGLFAQGSFWLATSLLHLWLTSDRKTED